MRVLVYVKLEFLLVVLVADVDVEELLVMGVELYAEDLHADVVLRVLKNSGKIVPC